MRTKVIPIIGIAGILFFCLQGCAVRTRVVKKPRVDQELYGNRGMFVGTPEPPSERPKTRKMLEVEVELPGTRQPKTSAAEDDTGKWGNRGYIGEKEPAPTVHTTPPPEPPEEPEPAFYTVKPGESLQDIAKDVYGDSGKWLHIYKANRDKVSDPAKIQPGMKLRIPKVAEAEKK